MEYTVHKEGCCDICFEWKKTIEFEEETYGYYGYHVSFEICKECFIAKLESGTHSDEGAKGD